MKINIIYLVKDAMRTKNVHEFINRRFVDKTKSIMNRRFMRNISTIKMKDGNHFDVVSEMNMVQDAYTDYDISRITPDDIVLDIGANIGGFSLRAARKAKHVFAVEPVMYEPLAHNIALNNMSNNITVLKCGLGPSVTSEIVFHGLRRVCELHTLNDLIEMCGGHVDYLKIDCEGSEWCVKPHEIDGINTIAGEIHSDDHNSTSDFTDMLSLCGMDYILRTTWDHRCTTFNAWKGDMCSQRRGGDEN